MEVKRLMRPLPEEVESLRPAPPGWPLADLLGLILPAAQLAFYLQMSALLQRAGELTELAEDDATVPFGVRDVLAVLLVGTLGCQRESGEAAVVVGANFCVVAGEADGGAFVWVLGGFLRG